MTDAANAVSTQGIREILSEINLGTGSSIQLMFAKLQLANAQLCKLNAENYLEDITETQEKQAEIADMIERARELRNQADASGKTVEMPSDMKEFFKDKGLSWDTHGSDDKHYASEWDYNIESLTNYQKQFENSTQTKMVYLQDFISQMNSYLQGANSAIQDSNQVLTSILTGR